MKVGVEVVISLLEVSVAYELEYLHDDVSAQTDSSVSDDIGSPECLWVSFRFDHYRDIRLSDESNERRLSQ